MSEKDRVNYMYGDFDSNEYKEPAMDDAELTLKVFETLLSYHGNVNQAIEETKEVLADLFPVGAED